MPFRRDLPALAIGGFLHLLIVVMIGYVFGPPVLRIAATLHLPFGLLVWGVLFVGLTVWLGRLVRRTPGDAVPHMRLSDRLRCRLLAGLRAAIKSVLAANLVLDLAQMFVNEIPSRRRFAADLDSATPFRTFMIATTVLSILVPMLWGALEHRFKGPAGLRGVAFAVVPMACSLLILLPAAGAGLLGLQLRCRPDPARGRSRPLLDLGVIGVTFPALATATGRWSTTARSA